MARVIRMTAIIVSLACVACRLAVRAGSPCGSPPLFAPFDDHRPPPHAAGAFANVSEGSPDDRADGVLDAIVAWYQQHGRARDLPGGGCRFAPTCSAYARAALQRYGPIAVILIVDRLLVREHVAAGAYYPAICIEHTTRLDDGVP